MFNFLTRDLSHLDFCSNPPLPDQVVVVPDLNDAGSPINSFKTVPRDHHSPFEKLVYEPSTMSLRAKLNMGVKLSPVSIQVENDPAVIQQIAQRFQTTLESRIANIQAAQVSVENDVES